MRVYQYVGMNFILTKKKRYSFKKLTTEQVAGLSKKLTESAKIGDCGAVEKVT